MSTPATKIHICSGVPLNNNYDHTLYFASSAAQLAYFQNKVVRTLSDYSYVRKSWKLKVQATMEEARVWSYLYFQNGTGNKWYFYFINQVEYINDSTVELSLEMDVMQTYMFEWKLRPCYVEREHSKTDTWGANTLDEGLDVGDLITAKRETIDLSSNLCIMTAASIDINKFYISGGQTEDKILGGYYDKLFGGFQITATPINDGDKGSLVDDFAIMLNYLSTKGKADTIFTMWQYPMNLVTRSYGDYEWCISQYVTGSAVLTHTASARPTSIDGYTPKNKKVLQYPYCFMYVTNNAGGAAVYQYERFSTENRTFRVQGNIAPDAVVKLVPVLYKGVEHNYDEALAMGNYPICSWNSDPYKLWLAQNQNQQNLGMAMSGLKIAGGVAAAVGGIVATGGTGGAAGALGVGGITAGASLISSGVTEISSQLAQRADKDVQPPQARGTISGSHNISRGLQNFDFYHKTIDAYHAEMIDNYFSMYGYATRKVKTPNIAARKAWTYVKTVGSNVGGNFCQEDLRQINAIFDKGITFWKNTDVGNYALDNTP